MMEEHTPNFNMRNRRISFANLSIRLVNDKVHKLVQGCALNLLGLEVAEGLCEIKQRAALA